MGGEEVTEIPRRSQENDMWLRGLPPSRRGAMLPAWVATSLMSQRCPGTVPAWASGLRTGVDCSRGNRGIHDTISKQPGVRVAAHSAFLQLCEPYPKLVRFFRFKFEGETRRKPESTFTQRQRETAQELRPAWRHGGR